MSAEGYSRKAKLNEDKSVYIEPSWRGVVRWGGLSLLVSGAIAVLFFVLVVATQQTLPVPAEEALAHPWRPTALFTLTAIGEVLLLPSALALYFSLRSVRNTPMFIATALWALCVPMFLASRGQIIALSQISSRYLATTDATMRASYLAAAELALETQNLYAMMGLVLLSVASIMVGTVMLAGKRVFGKRIGYVVIGAGAFTIFGAITVITQIPIIVPVIGVILTAIWQFYVGFRLLRLGEEGSRTPEFDSGR
jgi:hypothetical protein